MSFLMLKTMKDVYAFESHKDSPCDNCLELVRKWNNRFMEGLLIQCTDCDNTLVMKLLKKPASDLFAYGLCKSEEDFDIIPELMALDASIYKEEDLPALSEKYGLTGEWIQYTTKNEDLLVFMNNDAKDIIGDSSLDKFYVPCTGGILRVSCVKTDPKV